MVEIYLAFFLIKEVLTIYLAEYSQEAIVFIFVISILHLIARLFKRRSSM